MCDIDIVRVLKASGKTIATAESCTGGLVAKTITDVPGSSEVFKYGIVSYSNDAKMQLLNVRKETLDTYTEVSPETAIEMARGVRYLSGAFVGVSTTGYAGGYNNEEGDGNGLVYVGVCSADGFECVQKIYMPGSSRDQIRQTAMLTALDMVVKAIYRVG